MPKLTATQLDRIKQKIRAAAAGYCSRRITALGSRPIVPAYTSQEMKALIESGQAEVVHPPLNEFDEAVYCTFSDCFKFPPLPGRAEAEAAAKAWDEGVETINDAANKIEERLLDEVILGDGMEALKRVEAAFAAEGA